MKTILLATDGSALADEALEFAIELCHDTGAELDVLSVTVPIIATRGGAVPLVAVEEPSETEKIARAATEKARAAGVRAEALTAHGQPATEIARVANERSAELIVAGSRGLGAIRGALLGSVSRRLIKHSGGIPVTVVKAQADHHDDVRIHHRRDLAHGIEQVIDEAAIDPAWRPFPLRSLVRYEVAAACTPALSEIHGALTDTSTPIAADALTELRAFMTEGATSPLFRPDPDAAAVVAAHLRDTITVKTRS
jgi:nucleotide-binding universal stress UspA family protein